MTPGRSTARWVDVSLLGLGAGVFAVASVTAIVGYGASIGSPFFDWTFYSGAVERWLAGEQIYPGARISTLGSAAGSSYAYPPASVPLMLPFATWPVGAILWETLIVGVFLLGLWRVVRVGWPHRSVGVFGLVLLLGALFDGITQGIAMANVNMASAGVLGLVWAGIRDPAIPAGILGVIKVFPIGLAAPAGVWALGRALAIAFGICLLTLPLVGVGAWADYVTGLLSSQPLCGDPTWVNLSLACQLAPVTGLAIAKWTGLVVSAGLILVALRAGRGFVGVCAAGLAILAPATELHAHYFAIVFVLGVIGLATLNLGRDRLPVQGKAEGLPSG